jgi:hypothetical protein
LSMVLDPCNSTLVPGIYGSSEGLLSRLKSEVNLPAFTFAQTTQTCGYCLWCPDFTNDGFNSGDFGGGNLMLWYSDDPGLNPVNNISFVAYGRQSQTAASWTTAATLQDPASTLINSDLVADLRVVSACMKASYFGSMFTSSGEIGFIENLPASALLGPVDSASATFTSNPSSVNQLMRYCNRKQRFGTDTFEMTYRLNELSSDHFRDDTDNLFQHDIAGVDATRLAPVADAVSPRVFGYVWRNTAPAAGLNFEFTKSVEWRPRSDAGLTQVTIKASGASKVPALNTLIDNNSQLSSLRTRVVSSVGSVAGALAQASFTGASSYLQGMATNYGSALVGNVLTLV